MFLSLPTSSLLLALFCAFVGSAPLQTEKCHQGEVYPMRQCGYELRCHGNGIRRHRTASNSSCVPLRQETTAAFPTCIAPGLHKHLRSAHLSDCSRFLERRGVWMFHESRCPRGNSFNTTSCECEQSPTCFPTLDRHFRAFPIPNLSDKYEIEAQNENVVVQCIRGEQFNPYRSACEAKEDVQELKTDEDAAFLQGTCKESMRKDGYRIHPNDCSKYFQCAQGRWFLMHCPASLVFDPEFVRCDHKKE